MTVFHKAWAFLKASRQTELGEFHPDFPSSYGPVTLVSNQFTQRGFDKWNTFDFDEKLAQPFESLIHQGMTGKPVSNESKMWERIGSAKSPRKVKRFVFNHWDKGNWFGPFQPLYEKWKQQRELYYDPNSTPTYNFDGKRRTVGVRMPLDSSLGMFRDKGYGNEGAEAFIYGDIPAERLVMMPNMQSQDKNVSWPGGLGRVDE